MRKQKKKKKNTPITFIVYIILFAILIYSGIKIYKWYKDNKDNSKLEEEINTAVVIQEDKQEEEKYIIDFNSLKEKNDETVAWIAVNNTNVKYPVVKTKNNEFYLNHSFDKSENLGGWIFADYKNKFNGTDKNIVIYGHNMKDNSMFGTMQNILNPEWYNNEENTNIILKTERENYIYKVFSIYRIENEDYYIKTEFNNDSEFEQFLNTLKARSIRDFNMDMLESDSILTLSTCDNNNKYRVVLHAKKI